MLDTFDLDVVKGVSRDILLVRDMELDSIQASDNEMEGVAASNMVQENSQLYSQQEPMNGHQEQATVETYQTTIYESNETALMSSEMRDFQNDFVDLDTVNPLDALDKQDVDSLLDSDSDESNELEEMNSLVLDVSIPYL